MIELRLLPGLALHGVDPAQSRAVLAQPRRAALFIYLTVTAPAGLTRRDRLITMFWPDADPAQARVSLRQALAFLRRALGEKAIVTRDHSRGDEEVGVDLTEVRCDVHTLNALIDAGQLGEAVALYHGTMLGGFPPTGVVAFERWLDETRDHYRGRVRLALRTLTERDARSGNTALAIQWARRDVAIEPTDEEAAIRLMQLLTATGDTAGALEAYDTLVSTLARELDEQPGPDVAALAADLRARKVDTTETAPIPPSVRPPGAPAGPPPRRRRWALPLAIATGIALLAATTWVLPRAGRTGVPVARRRAPHPTLAVLPFRVAGAAPPLAYLRAGMPDLITARLGGDGGWTVDNDASTSRRLVAAQPAAAEVTDADVIRISRDIGVDELLTGSVVGSGARVVVQASIRSAGDGREAASASAEGPADSISTLADRIAVKLLVYRAGYRTEALDALARRPLAAVRDFLGGEIALRQGRYDAALALFARALGIDPTFPQAALGQGAAARRIGEWVLWQSGLTAAWARRNELGPSDSLYLVALAGPQFPKPSPRFEQMRAWERVVEQDPARPEGWYELGDLLARWGPVIGIDGSRAKARAMLTRALATDSLLPEPAEPLIELAIGDADSVTVRRLFMTHVVSGATGEASDYLRWRVAVFFGDEPALRELRARMPSMSYGTLMHIAAMGQVDGVGEGDVARAFAVLRARTLRPSQAGNVDIMFIYWALNRGAPVEALATGIQSRDPAVGTSRDQVRDALYGGGDGAAATVAAAALEREASARSLLWTTIPNSSMGVAGADLCMLEQWRLWHGDHTGIAAAEAELRQTHRPEHSTCASLLAAMDAVLAGRPEARASVGTFDEQLRTGWALDNENPYGSVVAQRLWERVGDPRRALAAARRRPYHQWQGPWYLGTLLAAEARLARVVGDSAGARRAEIHLTALRNTPH